MNETNFLFFIPWSEKEAFSSNSFVYKLISILEGLKLEYPVAHLGGYSTQHCVDLSAEEM